jgi:Flp pilus assembly protein TadD
MRGIIVGLCLVACPGNGISVIGQDAKRSTIETLDATGRAAMAEGRYAEAQEDFQRIEEADPSIAEVHATLAAIRLKQREYDKAISEVHTALKLKPALARLDVLLGLSLSEFGRFDEALPNLVKGFKQ